MRQPTEQPPMELHEYHDHVSSGTWSCAIPDTEAGTYTVEEWEALVAEMELVRVTTSAWFRARGLGALCSG